MLIRELVQLIQFRLQYLKNLENYLEVSLFIFTIIFASVRSNKCYCTQSWQWQIGVIAVFLSWITLIFSIRRLPIFGIYVVMYLAIFYNLIRKVVVLALLLVFAFAVPFYMIFYDTQDKSKGIVRIYNSLIYICFFCLVSFFFCPPLSSCCFPLFHFNLSAAYAIY